MCGHAQVTGRGLAEASAEMVKRLNTAQRIRDELQRRDGEK
jgi:hypothetical protein